MPGPPSFRVGLGPGKLRSLVINAVRRGPSSSVSAVNFNPSPLPGFTCRTTASALICKARQWTGIKIHRADGRSEEHTSELQSPDHLVSLLLLQKKNNILPHLHHT